MPYTSVNSRQSSLSSGQVSPIREVYPMGSTKRTPIICALNIVLNSTDSDIPNNVGIDSNVNLLQDLDFMSANTGPPMAAFDANNVLKPSPPVVTPTSPLSGGMAFNASLQRNTSTPNLTILDPLAQLGSFLTSTVTTTAPNIPRVNSYSTFQTANPPKPDYNRSNFNEVKNTTTSTACNAKVMGNAFEDLLGGFKPTQNETTNKSISQMRDEEMLKDGTMDPMRLKVMKWKEGKTRNIRALLCSLNVIIWEGCNWQPIGMHQLVTASDVKKFYRKACLAVHPDK
ncbi:unnamed protein product, partial [Medioppia subpectinata]